MFAPHPELDNNYTVFGRVVAGMDAVDKIAPGEPPAEPTKIVQGVPAAAKARGAMRVDLFDFELPPERIALRPARPRDSARLLLVEGSDISDRQVLDLPDLLRPGDVLVFNDTKVIPAQLEGRRGEASIGATLHKREGPREWQAFLRNAKRARVGDTIDFGEGVQRVGRREGRGRLGAAALHGDEPVELLLERAGRMPLPPYIASKRAADERGPRRLSDDVRARGRGGRRADRRAALHAAAARGARRARHRPRDADAARRRRHLPAGQGRGHRASTRCTPNGAGSTRRPRSG